MVKAEQQIAMQDNVIWAAPSAHRVQNLYIDTQCTMYGLSRILSHFGEQCQCVKWPRGCKYIMSTKRIAKEEAASRIFLLLLSSSFTSNYKWQKILSDPIVLQWLLYENHTMSAFSIQEHLSYHNFFQQLQNVEQKADFIMAVTRYFVNM